MKFTVLSAVKFNGRIYTEGETLEVADKEADLIPSHCVEAQAKPKKESAKAAEAKTDEAKE